MYHTTANRNPKDVFAWQDICITLDDKGIFEKDMYPSKEGLKNKLLITPNPNYQFCLYRKYAEYVKEKMKSRLTGSGPGDILTTQVLKP